MALELGAVLLPHQVRQRAEVRQLPARLADDQVAVEIVAFESGHLNEAEFGVLYPVPVGAHLHHAPKSLLAGVQGAAQAAHVDGEQHGVLRGAGGVAHDHARQLHPDGRAVLVEIAPLQDARLGLARNRLHAAEGGRFQVFRMDHIEVRLLQQLVFRVAEQAAKGRVDGEKPAAYGERRQTHRALLEQRAERDLLHQGIMI